MSHVLFASVCIAAFVAVAWRPLREEQKRRRSERARRARSHPTTRRYGKNIDVSTVCDGWTTPSRSLRALCPEREHPSSEERSIS